MPFSRSPEGAGAGEGAWKESPGDTASRALRRTAGRRGINSDKPRGLRAGPQEGPPIHRSWGPSGRKPLARRADRTPLWRRELEMPAKSICGVVLISRDPESLARFYGEAFALPLQREDHGGLAPHWGVD